MRLYLQEKSQGGAEHWVAGLRLAALISAVQAASMTGWCRAHTHTLTQWQRFVRQRDTWRGNEVRKLVGAFDLCAGLKFHPKC